MRFLLPFCAWVALGLVGVVALGVSYDLETLPAVSGTSAMSDLRLRALIMVQPAILLVIAVALGVGLSEGAGLRAWLTDRLRGRAEAFPGPVLPVALGFLGGVLIVLADTLFFQFYQNQALAEAGRASAGLVSRFAAITYGGVVEELMLRYGLMTLLFWIAARLGGRAPAPVVGWPLIVVVALLFGAGHLPALATLTPLDAPVVIRTVLLNTVLGVVFGWLYWRRGLEAGIMAHMASHPGMWAATALL